MMKKILMLVLLLSTLTQTVTSFAGATKSNGEINQINSVKLDIKVNGVNYKLSNTVKVYGFNGNKYLNVKKLIPSMFIDFKYSSGKKIKTITEIWVQAD